MKRRVIVFACIATVVLTGIALWSRHNPTPFFRSASPDLDSLPSEIAYLQSKLGVETYRFKFLIPPHNKLLATFVAALDGEVVPEMSGTYTIPPAEKYQTNEGTIWVNFIHPVFQTKRPQHPTWELHFSGAVNHTFIMRSPFDPSISKAARSIGVSRTGHGSLQDGRDYKVWEYHTSSKASDGSGDQGYDFKYTLTVRLERLEEGDELGEIRRIEISEPK